MDDSFYKENIILLNEVIKKIEKILDEIKEEKEIKGERNPIKYTTTRIKAEESMKEKLRRKKLEVSLENALTKVYDAAGVRVICEYIDDVYSIVECIKKYNEIEIIKEKDYIKKLVSIFKKVGLDINGLVPVTLAERNLILDVNELNDNVMVLDIGAGNTEIGVFEGSSYVYTNTIPLGGDNISNDIALVLNISEEEAEKLKRQYGLALKSFIDNDNDILLNTVREENKNKTIKSSELIEIMEARIEEIFSLVNKDITLQNIKPRVNNVILTGQGISNINKSDVAGKIILNIPVKMATGRLISTVKPTYRTAYALVRYIASKPFTKSVSSSIDTEGDEGFIKTIFEKIKECGSFKTTN